MESNKFNKYFKEGKLQRINAVKRIKEYKTKE